MVVSSLANANERHNFGFDFIKREIIKEIAKKMCRKAIEKYQHLKSIFGAFGSSEGRTEKKWQTNKSRENRNEQKKMHSLKT